MAYQQPQQVPVVEEPLVRARLDFAQRCFNNAQDLNRLMDQKAGFLLTAVGLLTSASAILIPKVVSPQSLVGHGWSLQVLAMGVLAVYIVMAFVAIYVVSGVYRASPHSRRQHPQAPGLIFPLMILERLATDPKTGEEQYFADLANVDLAGMLHDYAHQVIELSYIYARKQTHVNWGIRLFRGMAIVWLIALLLVYWSS
jgi:hypothetical protein